MFRISPRPKVKTVISLFLLILVIEGLGQAQNQYGWSLVVEDLGVESMYLDNSGILWMATEDDGLWRQNEGSWQPIEGFGGVSTIYETKDGTLWVGAEDGLWYQEGEGWQLLENFDYGEVSAIYETKEGLWVGTQRGLVRRDENGWQIIVEEEGEDFWFTGIYESQDGTLVVVAEEFTVYRLPPSAQEGNSLTGPIHEDTEVHKDTEGNLWVPTENEDFGWVRTIYETKDNTLWLATENGLWRLGGNGWQLVSEDVGWVLTIYEGTDGTMWLGTVNGLWRQEEDGWLPDQAEFGPSALVSAIRQSRDGTLWVGTMNGLWRQVNLGWQPTQEVTGPIFPGDAFFQSQAGTLWVEAEDGLWYQEGGNWQPIEGFGEGWKGIYETKDGTLWIGSEDGLWHQDGNGWQIVPQFSGDELSGELSQIYETKDGILWVATSDWEEETDTDTIRLWRQDGKGWQIVHEIIGWLESFYESTDGTLWLGTNNGLWRQDGNSWQIVPQFSGEVSTIYESKDGILWVATASEEGTEDDGLWRQDGNGWQIVLKDTGWVLTIYESKDGTLWLGAEYGLWRKNEGDAGWLKEAHVKGPVGAIFEDADGVLWTGHMMSTIWCKIGSDSDELWFHYDLLAYNQLLGVPSSGVSTIYQTPDGTLWFGGLGGLTQYTPDINPPNIKILGVDNKPIIDNYLTGRPVVNFQWTADDIETMTEHIRYQYKIDDQQWVYNLFAGYDQTLKPDSVIQQTELIQQITTPVLEDGKHTFSVRAIDYDGNLSRIVTFDFTVDTVRPSVLIDKPVPNQMVGGELAIWGSILDDDLSQFQLEYRPLSSDRFQLIASGDQPQTSSILANWKTQSLPDGAYQIRVVATDQLGHSKEHQVDITLDNTPPVVSLKTPAAGQELSGSLKITAQAGDLHLQQYRLKYTQDLPLTSKSKWESIPTSVESLSTNPTQIDQTWNSAAVFGPTLIRLLVLDQAGNQQTAEAVINLNNLSAKPQVQITSPTVKSVLSGLIRIQGTVSDPTLTSYTIEVESDQKSAAWTPIVSQVTGVNSGELGAWDTTAVSDGGYRLRLSGVDSNGYQSQVLLSVQVDNTPPIAIIQRPEQVVNDRWIASGKIAIRGTASDQNLESHRLEYGSGITPDVWQAIAGVSQAPVQDAVLQEWDTSRLAGGEYTLRLTVTDQAGLSSESRLKLTLDNQQAGAELMAPGQNQYVNSQVAIIGTADDKNFKGYRVELGAGDKPESWEVLTQSATIRQSEGLYNWDTSGLEGQYTLKLVVEDFTNGQVVVNRQVMVDNTPPQAQITVPETDAIVSGNLKIVGTATDSYFDSYLLQQVNGANPEEGDWQPIEGVSATPVNSSTLRQFATTTVADGIYSLRLRVTDKVGQITTVRRTITIDNTPPKVTLQSPTQNQVVSQTVGIMGVVSDANLEQVQVFFRRSGNWRSVTTVRGSTVSDRLAEWDTARLADGEYQLKLVATDGSGQPPTELTRTVIVDNTPPQAEIVSPRNNDQVGQVVVLSGTASDANFKSYRVEFGEGVSPAVWVPASVRNFQTQVEQGELYTWLPGKRTGLYSLRLTAIDQVNQQSQVQVRVSITSLTEKAKGGVVSSADGGVSLYLPPNSLQKDAIVTVNRIPASAITWPAATSWQALDLVCQIEADPPRLSAIKPATLTISYDGVSLTPGKEPTIFLQANNQQWQLIGGTVNAGQQTVSTVIEQLGRYAVMEMAPVGADSSAQLLEKSLTCQPRAFSPRGNTFNTETAISFSLDKPASATIKVYNVAGHLVRLLAYDRILSGGRNALAWNGRDSDNEIVPTGAYIVAVTIGDRTETKVVSVYNR